MSLRLQTLKVERRGEGKVEAEGKDGEGGKDVEEEERKRKTGKSRMQGKLLNSYQQRGSVLHRQEKCQDGIEMPDGTPLLVVLKL